MEISNTLKTRLFLKHIRDYFETNRDESPSLFDWYVEGLDRLDTQLSQMTDLSLKIHDLYETERRMNEPKDD